MLKMAIDLQQRAVEQLVQETNNKNEITFKAPTGSGKTYMMADYMNRILSENSDIVFLVSSLSKGNLAQQNYEKFIQYSQSGNFPNLNSYIINTDISGEESLFIPTDYNVYLLPRDLYKKGGRLMNGAMFNFLNTMTSSFMGKNKKIYLIKDECHIDTSNLNDLSENYFTKIINFSATPNLKRGQTPDIEITETDAVQAGLIKNVEYGKEEDSLDDALDKFEKIKGQYIDSLGINPCLIIQISNKDKAEEELQNTVFPALNRHKDLKWMLIVDKSKNAGADTNDVFKVKKLPVSKWRDYAKENTSTIDVIIFKMVISEGWDIPRACMLYQVRDTSSKQLDEQVMGRVRRNPRLFDFENLSEESKKLATTAWVWGVVDEDKTVTRVVNLYDEPTDITDVIKLKTTRIKPLKEKSDFDLDSFMKKQDDYITGSNIFDLFRKLNRSEDSIKEMCYDYADTIDKWWKFNDNIENITKEYNRYSCDYDTSMETVKDEDGNDILASFPVSTFYIDNENYLNISNWVWKRKGGSSKFSFDSEAEREWASILKDLSFANNVNNDNVVKGVLCGKNNPSAKGFLKEQFPQKLDPTEKFLWGKNYVPNSDIKYEYYLDGIHFSYPDFIMMDSFGRIHIFEVKSVNTSNNVSSGFDSEQYNLKIKELEKCYLKASSLTGHIFYLPVQKGDNWHIIRLMNGKREVLTQDTFEIFVKNIK